MAILDETQAILEAAHSIFKNTEGNSDPNIEAIYQYCAAIVRHATRIEAELQELKAMMAELRRDLEDDLKGIPIT